MAHRWLEYPGNLFLIISPVLWWMYIIILPFAAVMVAIIVNSMLRSVRRINRLKQSHQDQLVSAEQVWSKSYDQFHDQTWLPLCNRVAGLAEGHLSRKLTREQRKKIWRAKTLLVLEILISEIDKAADPAAVSQLISSLPSGFDRPDPTNWQR